MSDAQQKRNYLRAERAAREYAAWLRKTGGSDQAIALALAHADRHAADAALIGARRRLPL